LTARLASVALAMLAAPSAIAGAAGRIVAASTPDTPVRNGAATTGSPA